jgi:hypothetical protein
VAAQAGGQRARPQLAPAAPEHTPPARAAVPALQSYDASEFDKLAEKYEKLNWRIIR